MMDVGSIAALVGLASGGIGYIVRVETRLNTAQNERTAMQQQAAERHADLKDSINKLDQKLTQLLFTTRDVNDRLKR